jgi:hypothetical protein
VVSAKCLSLGEPSARYRSSHRSAASRTSANLGNSRAASSAIQRARRSNCSAEAARPVSWKCERSVPRDRRTVTAPVTRLGDAYRPAVRAKKTPPISGGFLEADEGTRTLDLLHGKGWCAFAPVCAGSPKPSVCSGFRSGGGTHPNLNERRLPVIVILVTMTAAAPSHEPRRGRALDPARLGYVGSI